MNWTLLFCSNHASTDQKSKTKGCPGIHDNTLAWLYIPDVLARSQGSPPPVFEDTAWELEKLDVFHVKVEIIVVLFHV